MNLRGSRRLLYASVGLALLLAVGCGRQPGKRQGRPPIFELLSASVLPDFHDDLKEKALESAVQSSIDYYRRLPHGRRVALGRCTVAVEEMRESLELFLDLLRKGLLDRSHISRYFDVYKPIPSGERQDLLVTGYYEPVLDARLKSDKIYRYPIYGVPDDLVRVDLERFGLSCSTTTKIVGRVDRHQLLPYYSRSEIDGLGKLKDKGCELAWLKDPVAVFFLQVQGSGALNLGGGLIRRIGYAASNGWRYRSIGKYLVDQGMIPRDEISLQSIRTYLQRHPQRTREVLFYNESYVFFRWVEKGPMGSLNVLLTPGRSVAVDQELYPRGGLAFLETSQPRVDSAGKVIEWQPAKRWVVIQDSGGAIKGWHRLDLFCGTGKQAEWIAGRMKERGSIYVLVKKGTPRVCPGSASDGGGR